MGPGLVLALMMGADAPEDVIVKPDWAQRPSVSEIRAVFPPAAMWFGLEGKVTLECGVSVDGRAKDCIVLDETPPGYGFGAATLRATSGFRFRPQTVNGVPTSDGTVRFSINYVTTADKASVKLASRCAGWAQAAAERTSPAPARLVWAYTYWRFAYTATAARSGEKPSAIARRLEESRKIAAPRLIRASNEYQDCWREAYRVLPVGFMPGGPQ